FTITLFTLLLLNSMVYAMSMQGQPAPTFNLADQSGELHQLADYQDQYLVVYFYPKNDTTGCTIEAKAFRDNYANLKAMNTVVLGVSLDDAESHRAFIEKYELPFNLLVDADKQMSRDYGVDGGMAFFSYAKRQTFIIDPQGQIAVHFEEVNPSTHADQVIAALKKLQAEVTSPKSTDQVSVTEVIDGAAVFGQKWPLDQTDTVGIAAVLSQPVDYMEANHVITGNVTRVCQKKGCWMILTDGDAFARVDFNDHAFLIPKDSNGSAEVYGRLVEKELSEEQRAHYASEGSGELPAKSYEIVADAVKIIGS
ncbi:Thiol peroxidase, Bcp-type, partial [hydrothermal vent metagenome]